VFFDRTRTVGDNADVRDLTDDCHSVEQDAIPKVTFATIQAQGDGSTNTLLFAEGLNALHWTFVAGDTHDEKWHFGFCWEQPDAIAKAQQNAPSNPDERDHPGFRFINGVRELLPANHVGEKSPNAAIPSSNHPGGVNVAFVGGQVILLSERISPTVYAQLMTINHKLSDLEVNDVKDRDLPMPDADDY
jgi:prepilin-type processing-associated H-X9-DG protein